MKGKSDRAGEYQMEMALGVLLLDHLRNLRRVLPLP